MEVKKIKNKNIALATVGADEKPHNIVVEVNRVYKNKILLTDNYMNTTIKNIRTNPNVSLVFWEGDIGLGIDGVAKYFDSGKWVGFVKSLPENRGLDAKGAIVINIKEIRKL